jgi:hypothetical protein
LTDLKHNNHNLKNYGIANYHFFCDKCNMLFYESIDGAYWVILENNSRDKNLDDLTCEEIIIKKIIE